jgi:predicted metal-dependent phosphoesterase TrpH
LIDLHSHTNESDGSCSPAELIEEAVRRGVRTLGITDHDTLKGYDKAVPSARAAGVELVCGIELSTKFRGKSVHLLGYFLEGDGPAPEFREWILDMQAARLDRNIRLIARLRDLGIEITLEEVQARSGGLTARPHFAQVMLEKGYVTTLQQAFDLYLDEAAKGYVYRREPLFAEGVELIRKAGGTTSLAHPVRVQGDLAAQMPELCATGLDAIEAYHSDHDQSRTEQYLAFAKEFGLLVTGGSDFHGTTKPGLCLGTGRNHQLRVPEDLLDNLRAGLEDRRKSHKGCEPRNSSLPVPEPGRNSSSWR